MNMENLGKFWCHDSEGTQKDLKTLSLEVRAKKALRLRTYSPYSIPQMLKSITRRSHHNFTNNFRFFRLFVWAVLRVETRKSQNFEIS